MEPDRPARPRPTALTALEEKLLEASMRQRLFQRPVEAILFGRYRLLERLGQGAMGVVFSAYDPQLERRVALKILHLDRGKPGAAQRARLRREAQSLGRLSHPHVVQVYEIGEIDDQPFVAMEFVRGETVQAWLAARPRSVDAILDVFLQAGRGLAAAHAAGLVHRDFKPDNVMIGADGRVRVLDFGLARGSEPDDPAPPPTVAPDLEAPLTVTGALLGTPAYMAPEQAAGASAPVDARSDQFSFCVALYEALYRERPFAGESIETYFAAAAAGDVRPPPAHAAVPSPVRQALLRGLRHRPEDRWPDLDALLTALDRRPVRARLRVFALAGALALVVVALGVLGVLAIRAWQARAREALAAERLAAVDTQADDLLRAGEAAAGERLIAEFVTAPEIRGTSAVARAWSNWARRLAAEGAPSQTAWANAYAQAREDAPRHAALLGLAEAFRRERRWSGVARALSLAETEAPALFAGPELLPARVEAAAAARDIPTALELARAADPATDIHALAPVLEPLTRMTRTTHRRILRAEPSARDDLPGPILLLTEAEHGGTPGPLHLVRADATLSPLAPLAIRPAHAPGDVPLVLGATGEALVLHHSGPGGLAELQRWTSPGGLLAALAVDLDRDGAREIFVGLGHRERGLRELRPDGAGRWHLRVPHPATDATDSDVHALAALDLDGDAEPELVAAVGPWSAYDLRVFRPDPAGGLTLVARRKLGFVAGLGGLVDPAGRPLLVAATNRLYPSATVFPPDRPPEEGFHVLRLAGSTLVTERFLPLPADAHDQPYASQLVTGDLDGDGLTDLAARIRRRADPFDPRDTALLLARQRPTGDFAAITIGGFELVGLAQLDDDPAAELLLTGHEDGALWLAGVGDAIPPPSPLPGEALADAHAHALAAAGAPDEAVALTRAGLPDLALAVLAPAARIAGVDDRRRLHLAAARIAVDLGDDERAQPLLRDAADDPDLAPDALELLVAGHLRAGRLDDAARDLARLADAAPEPGSAPASSASGPANSPSAPASSASGAADPAAPARIDERRSALETLLARRLALPLRLTGEGAAGWSALAPVAVRADPLARGMILDSFADLPVSAAHPFAWDGERLLLEADIAPQVLDWSSSLAIRLFAGDGTLVAQLALRVAGGDGFTRLNLSCADADRRAALVPLGPVRPDGSFAPLTLRLDLDLAAGALECRVLDADRRPLGRNHVALSALPAPGRYRLELGPDRDLPGDNQARARVTLTRLELTGARRSEDEPVPEDIHRADNHPAPEDILRPDNHPAPEDILRPDNKSVPEDILRPDNTPVPEDILRPAALLADGDAHAAATLLAAVPGPDAAMLRAVSLAEAGRWSAAAVALARALADDPSQVAALRRWLRNRGGALGPVVREALGDPRYLELFAEAWQVPLQTPRLTPELARVLLDALPGVETTCATAVCADLLHQRGRARVSFRDLERARIDLLAALAATPQDPAGRARASRIHIDLAALAAARGDPDVALAHASQALEHARAPEIAADILRARPELAPLLAEPAWVQLLAAGAPR